MSTPFHLAVPVHDLAAARAFYRDLLGWRLGVSQDHCDIWDARGNQVVTHHVAGYRADAAGRNIVDDKNVPVPHFGMVLPPDEWRALRDRVEGRVEFVIKPHARYAGTTGEQSTMFFRDPSGNVLEFKAFENERWMFER